MVTLFASAPADGAEAIAATAKVSPELSGPAGASGRGRLVGRIWKRGSGIFNFDAAIAAGELNQKNARSAVMSLTRYDQNWEHRSGGHGKGDNGQDMGDENKEKKSNELRTHE